MTSINTLSDEVQINCNYDTLTVFVNGELLDPKASQKIINHSPDGFCWGYGGSGPSQFALALLLKFMDEESAKKYYQQFKWNVIAKFPKKNFSCNLNLKAEILKIKNGIV